MNDADDRDKDGVWAKVMAYKKDLTAQRFGRLVVTGFAGQDERGKSLWHCVCDCGNKKVVQGYSLGKYTLSCGCWNKEKANRKTHGMSDSRIYYIWVSMKERCHNQRHNQYSDYGGRGITVCAEWRDSFEEFRDWALANGYADNLTIDRMNTNGDYSSGNCRWATQKEQQNNRRNNRKVEYNGKVQSIAAWAEETGVKYATLYRRIVLCGWPPERALNR